MGDTPRGCHHRARIKPDLTMPSRRPLRDRLPRLGRRSWQRIQRAVDDLSMLPAVDLLQVGDEYYVADGHNRVAAALEAGAVAIDADVTELVMPGVPTSTDRSASHQDAASLLLGADEIRQAASGRQSRTAEHRPNVDELRREELTLGSERAEPEPDPEPDVG